MSEANFMDQMAKVKDKGSKDRNKISYAQALSEAQAEEMARDENVILTASTCEWAVRWERQPAFTKSSAKTV